MVTQNSLNTSMPIDVADGGLGAGTVTGILTGNGTSAISANAVTQYGVVVAGASNAVGSITVGTNGQVLVGSTGANPVFATISDGEGITTGLGAGTLSIACEEASDTNKGVASFDENDFLVSSGDVTIAARVRSQIGVLGGYVENLGITYTGNVLSVTGATAALSATNPGWITMQDKSSPGLLKTYEVTAAQGFIDDTGSSEIINNLFGLTTSVANATAIPFYLYAVTNDAETAIAFMISRVPGMKKSPVVAQIGAPDDAVANSQISFFSFDNLDETLYDTNPCLMIGSFRMVMSSSDDWTVQTLDGSDGIGCFQENRVFTMSTGQFGAASGKYWVDNAGTAPGFVTNIYEYYIEPFSAICYINSYFGNNNVAGVGNVNALLSLPYLAAGSTSINISGGFEDDSASIVTSISGRHATTSTATLLLYLSGGSNGGIKNQDFDASDIITFGIIFKLEYE